MAIAKELEDGTTTWYSLLRRYRDNNVSELTDDLSPRAQQRRTPLCGPARWRICRKYIATEHECSIWSTDDNGQCQLLTNDVTSYGAPAPVPPPLKLADVHQSGNFYLRVTPVSSGRLLVNITHCSVPATDSHSRLSWLSVRLYTSLFTI